MKGKHFVKPAGSNFMNERDARDVTLDKRLHFKTENNTNFSSVRGVNGHYATERETQMSPSEY